VANRNKCQGVICGHIHQAEIKKIEDILYINSGDWIESLTAAVEDASGNWNIIKQHREERRGHRKL
ncbi:MAG: UDP-2,3-diacylglucosamine diphosphatase, partial [Rikenellaceae bacterium]